MSRNVQLQVLRGTTAQLMTLQSGVDPDTGVVAQPLALGEMYFATDQKAFYLGTPGVGLGYIQVGDQTKVNERLDQLIVLMECVRRALVKMACEGKQGSEADFDPAIISEEFAAQSPTGV